MLNHEKGKLGVFNKYGVCLKAFRFERGYSSKEMNKLFFQWRAMVLKSAGILPISMDTKHLALVIEELESFKNKAPYKTLSRQDMNVSKTRAELVRHFAGFLGYTSWSKNALRFLKEDYCPHETLNKAELILEEMKKPNLNCPPAPIEHNRIDWIPYALASLAVIGVCFIVHLLGL